MTDSDALAGRGGFTAGFLLYDAVTQLLLHLECETDRFDRQRVVNLWHCFARKLNVHDSADDF